MGPGAEAARKKFKFFEFMIRDFLRALGALAVILDSPQNSKFKIVCL